MAVRVSRVASACLCLVAWCEMQEKASKHLKGGCMKVIISAPPKERLDILPDWMTFVLEIGLDEPTFSSRFVSVSSFFFPFSFSSAKKNKNHQKDMQSTVDGLAVRTIPRCL